MSDFFNPRVFVNLEGAEVGKQGGRGGRTTGNSRKQILLKEAVVHLLMRVFPLGSLSGHVAFEAVWDFR